MKFPRESATHTPDLPHQWQAAQDATAMASCDVCGAGVDDPRHASWEKNQLAERERAGSEEMTREFGS